MTGIRIKLLTLISLSTLFSCNQTSLKSPFVDNIKQGDTLTLFAEFADCGEWGGHIEKVYLTKKENNLWVTFYKDTVSCDNDPDATRKKCIENSKVLETADRNKVIEYIDSFIIASKTEQMPLSNASNYFKIISRDSTLKFIDWKMDWKEFNKMRQKIFN